MKKIQLKFMIAMVNYLIHYQRGGKTHELVELLEDLLKDLKDELSRTA